MLMSDEKTIQIWDKEDALQRVMQKNELLKMLINIFLDEMPERLIELKAAVNAKDAEQIRQISHTIKGVAGNLSALLLQKNSSDLESLAKSEKIDAIEQVFLDLEQSYNDTTTEFKSFINQ